MITFKPTLKQRARLLATGHPIHAFSTAVPVLSFYGGATVTRAHDAVGKLFTVCCAKNVQLNAFGLYSLKDGIAQQIAPLTSGRGSIWVSLFDGTASWVGWKDNDPPLGGPIPDFVPFKFTAQAAIKIPAGGAISQLWHGEYTATEFDTPEETAMRVEKLLKGVNEEIDLLIQGGYLTW